MSEYTAEDFAQANLATKDRFEVARRTEPSATHQWHVYGSRQGWLSDEEMAADGWVPVVESRVTEGTLRHVEERAERKRQKLIAHIESVEAAVRDRNRTIEELHVARQEASRRESAAHDRNMTLLDTKKTHEQAISDLRHDLEVAQKEMADLRQERDRLEGQLVVAGEQIESRRLVIENLLEENYRLDAKADGAISLDALEAAWEAAEQADECREGDVLIIRDDEDNYLVRRMEDRNRLDSTARILSRAPREPWEDLADVLRAHTGEPDPDETARTLYEYGVRMAGGGDDG